MENVKELFLEEEVFSGARQKFNMVLQRLFKNMLETNSTDAKITLSMDVKLKKDFIPNSNPERDGETREINLPDFSYKVTSAISVKDEEKGDNNPQMELVWDDELQKYVLKYVANTAQRSIFDEDFEDSMQPSGDGTTAVETSSERDYLNRAQIAGPIADEGALPDNGDEETPDSGDSNVGGDYVDGDYREVSGDTDGDSDDSGLDTDTDDADDTDSGDAPDEDYDYEDPA